MKYGYIMNCFFNIFYNFVKEKKIDDEWNIEFYFWGLLISNKMECRYEWGKIEKNIEGVSFGLEYY